MAYAGYIWMGLLFLFFSSAVAINFYNGILYIASKITSHDFGSFGISATLSFFLPVVYACLATIYGAYEAVNIRTEKIVIQTPKIPATQGKITIAQISDVHLGLIVREARLQRIMKAIRQADPDLLVSTGDLVDGQLDGLSGLSHMLQEFNPRYGKFAVTGNHEFYAGVKPSFLVTEQAGFTILRGESATVANSITIAGVDDPAGDKRGAISELGEHDLLAGLPRDQFTLLLKHRPRVECDSIGLFDLQLSGHVHKGQIFPFNLVTFLFYPIKTGQSFYPSGSSLYVSRGTGTWGPPIRFLAPPELTIIELVHSSNRDQ